MKENVLFLCTGNSCRSQMAEGLARKHLGTYCDSYSAGTATHGMNKRAVQVMQEIGIDLSTHSSKTVDHLPKIDFDLVVTVCSDANENCPYLPAKKIHHQPFDDPPRITKDFDDEEKILNVYRSVRDQIEQYIIGLKEDYIEKKI